MVDLLHHLGGHIFVQPLQKFQGGVKCRRAEQSCAHSSGSQLSPLPPMLLPLRPPLPLSSTPPLLQSHLSCATVSQLQGLQGG